MSLIVDDNRCTRLILLLGGIIQILRQEVSLYHLILLQDFSCLLTIPDALSYFPGLITAERLLCLAISCLGFMQTTFVAIVAMNSLPTDCDWADRSRLIQLACTPYFLYLSYFIAGKCFSSKRPILPENQ